jgi:beta-lactam-binding protein with PASTA domain
MDFRERKIDFEEADRRYTELKRQLEAGSISTEEFDAQRKQLMVQDEKGSWWAKGREDGDWYYRGADGWVKGTPPNYQPPPQTTSPDNTPTSDRNEGMTQTRSATPPLAARESYERHSKLPRVPILLPLLLLLVLLGGVAYALTRGTNENVEAPDLPDVRGETREEAVRILEGAGFEVEEETEESSAENEGSVTEQDPRGGETAEAGSTVTITVGAGPADTESKTGSVQPEPVTPEPEQTPGAGPADTESKTGSVQPEPVTPEPEQTPVSNQIPIPNVVGRNVEEAKQTIQNAGFAFAVETVESSQPAETVISTDPEPGTLVDPSLSTVIIRQSSGPPPPASNKGADTKTKGGDE